ncbi:MAG: hypothetical protein R3F20_11265 [Planctomycetota bacterium]
MIRRLATLAPIVLALLATGCASGINSSTSLTTNSVPLVGPAAGTALDLYDTTVTNVAAVAVQIVTSPFDAVEGALGMTPAEQRSVEALSGRFSPEERLARRRQERGLPAPPEARVGARQSSMRYDQRARQNAYFYR